MWIEVCGRYLKKIWVVDFFFLVVYVFWKMVLVVENLYVEMGFFLLRGLCIIEILKLVLYFYWEV